MSESPSKILTGSFSKANKGEIDRLLKKLSTSNHSLAEKINALSKKFLGTAYSAECVGDGMDMLHQPNPRVNLRETNCMVLIENLLAMTLSASWEDFVAILTQIRYLDGIIGMATRNHFVAADWLPNNRWLLDDVTAKMGERHHLQKVTRVISRRDFFRKKNIKDIVAAPDQTLSKWVMPIPHLNLNRLKVADMVCLVSRDYADIFVIHMAMVVSFGKERLVLESAKSLQNTATTPIAKWFEQKKDEFAGVLILRVKKRWQTLTTAVSPLTIAKLAGNANKI
jgi:hypothetical protein